jgi:hypothetical protein
MYGQIDAERHRKQTNSGFFANSGVKRIPNAIALYTQAAALAADTTLRII